MALLISTRTGLVADSVLVARAATGEEAAVREFVVRYWRVAYRTAYLLVLDVHAAEDLAQESLLAAVRGLKAFDQGRPLFPWLHRIVVNQARDRYRWRERRPELLVADPHSEPIDEGIADEIAARSVSSELLQALERLEPEFREAVVMRHLLDIEPAEIGEITGVPAATVRTRVHRGLAKLKKLLDAERSEV